MPPLSGSCLFIHFHQKMEFHTLTVKGLFARPGWSLALHNVPPHPIRFVTESVYSVFRRLHNAWLEESEDPESTGHLLGMALAHQDLVVDGHKHLAKVLFLAHAIFLYSRSLQLQGNRHLRDLMAADLDAIYARMHPSHPLVHRLSTLPPNMSDVLIHHLATIGHELIEPYFGQSVRGSSSFISSSSSSSSFLALLTTSSSIQFMSFGILYSKGQSWWW